MEGNDKMAAWKPVGDPHPQGAGEPQIPSSGSEAKDRASVLALPLPGSVPSGSSLGLSGPQVRRQ